jgi:hypothetical protein
MSLEFAKYSLGHFFTKASGHPASDLVALALWSSGIVSAYRDKSL